VFFWRQIFPTSFINFPLCIPLFNLRAWHLLKLM
jgi:hypothetical protein